MLGQPVFKPFPTIEEQVLAALCWHDTLAPQIAAAVKVEDFSIEVYRLIAKAALRYLERHQRPAQAHLGDLLEPEFKFSANGRFLFDIVNQLEHLAPQLDAARLPQNLDDFLIGQQLLRFLTESRDILAEAGCTGAPANEIIDKVEALYWRAFQLVNARLQTAGYQGYDADPDKGGRRLRAIK
jgi:hypothetical protein